MLERGIEGILFRSRWLMAPFYIGLVVALLVLLFKFGHELLHFVRHAMEATEADTILGILTLVDRSLDSPIGRALLAPRPWARSDYALAGIHGERWVNAVLDRCFETEDALWVVDYKTTAHPLEAAAHALYVDQARQRYRDQLVRYTALLAAHRPGKPVISAFYFVEPDRLVTADGAALPPPAY